MDKKSTMITSGDGSSATGRSSSERLEEPGELKASPAHASIPPSGPQSAKQESDTSEGTTITSAASQKATIDPPSSHHNSSSSKDSIDSETCAGNSSDTDETASDGSASREADARGSVGVDTDQSNQGSKETKAPEGEKKPLRKGKWAVEEEEFTSRVIHHFSAGLLTLPDGATLRSYLAEKLNCDPMRITKKFTGACCLGRRVYHLRDRPRATSAELEMAKVERDLLERRFRLRIDHEQSGLPLSRRREMLLAQSQGNLGTIYPLQNFSSGNTLSPWLNNLGTGLTRVVQPAFPLSGNQAFLSGGQAQLPPNTLQHNASRWLIPGASESVATNLGHVDPSIQLLNNIVTSWAVAQATASIPSGALASFGASSASVGSITSSSIRSQPPIYVAQQVPAQSNLELQLQLRNAYEEQRKEEEQRQLRAAFEEEKKKKEEKEQAAAAAAASPVAVASKETAWAAETTTKPAVEEISPAEQLQKSYEAHLQTLKNVELSKEQKGNTAPARTKNECGNDQPMADEEAGTVLLGFLNSLRQSYEDAVEEKIGEPVDEQFTKKKTTESKVSPRKSSTAVNDKAEPPRSNIYGGVKRSQGNISNSSKSPKEDNRNGQNLSSAVSKFMTSKMGRRSQRPASVTDASSGNSSSQQAEFSSSLEDSSDKTDPSSSEESEKEEQTQWRRASKGPPRKRLKSFTAENLIAHGKRMSEGADD